MPALKSLPLPQGRTSILALCAMLLVGAWFSTAAHAEESAAKSAPTESTQKRLEEAQRRLDQAAHEVAELSMSMTEGRDGPLAIHAHGRRHGFLGLVFNMTDDADSGDGVRVASVTPGGAAEAAGLRAGDTLLEINGKTLKREGESSGRERLLSVTRTIKPGEKVALSYRRDGKVAKIDVVARAPSFDESQPFAMMVPDPNARPFIARRGFWRGAQGAFGSTELVALTPKLGQYFGSDKGLLVVRAPQDSRLNLEEGDVILDIDGRVPASPGHAFKILGSYQAGEKVKLNVLRMKKRVTVDVVIPQDSPRSAEDFPPMRFSTHDGLGTALEPAPPLPPPPGEPES